MRFSITPLGGAGRSVTRIVDAIARYLQPPHPRTLRRYIDAIGDWSRQSHSAGDGFVLPRPGWRNSQEQARPSRR